MLFPVWCQHMSKMFEDLNDGAMKNEFGKVPNFAPFAIWRPLVGQVSARNLEELCSFSITSFGCRLSVSLLELFQF